MTTPPKEWGKLMAGFDMAMFRRYLARESDVERLRAAAEREHKRPYETRNKRIALINQRIQKLK